MEPYSPSLQNLGAEKHVPDCARLPLPYLTVCDTLSRGS